MTRLSTLRLVAIATVLVTIAGCGASKSKSTSTTSGSTGTSGTTTTGHTAGGLAAAASAWAHAVASKDCAALAKVAYAPTFPAARCKAVETSAPRPTVGHVAAYGAGGVADLSLGAGQRAASIFVIGRDHTWRYLALLRTARPIVGTHAADPKAGEKTIKRVLEAIAKGSCKPVASDFPMVKGKTKRTPSNCFAYSGTPFQKLLKQGVGAATPTGGNARVSFYRVRLGKKDAHRFNVILLFESGTPRFFGALPIPPAAVAPAKKG